MRKGFLVPGMLLLAASVLHCSGNKQFDDDDNGGESSSRGGKRASGGSTSAGSGHGGTSEASGGTGDTTMSGAGADNGPTGGTDATGGTRAAGGTDSAGGTRAAGGSANNEAGAGDAVGASGETGTGGSRATGGSSSSGGSGGKTGAGGSSGSGGSGGKSGAGGTGGHGGLGGAGGSGAITCGPGLGLALTPAPGQAVGSGWIDGSTNCVGIQGAVYLDYDLYGSSITLTSADGHICVSGYTTQVLDDDYADMWGANINVQLNNPGTDVADPYNANTYGVTGFAFDITGTTPPSIIRPTLQVNGTSTQYCESVCASGEQSLLISNAESACYDTGTHTIPDAAHLTLLQFYLPANADGEMSFNFCIDDLRVLTTTTSVGDPGTCGGGSTTTIGSCSTGCGGSTVHTDCYCDTACVGFDDCCSDYDTYCL